ncbi:MAG: hypothetical protein DMF86_23515 [Acidobacteria bacterium]|nr:MAG: hypothetical protein DMF86_23515 [Acidobacteriota bacterium]
MIGDILLDVLEAVVGGLLPGPSTDRGLLVLALVFATGALAGEFWAFHFVRGPLHGPQWAFGTFALGMLFGMTALVISVAHLLRVKAGRPLAAFTAMVAAIASGWPLSLLF